MYQRATYPQSTGVRATFATPVDESAPERYATIYPHPAAGRDVTQVSDFIRIFSLLHAFIHLWAKLDIRRAYVLLLDRLGTDANPHN